MKLNIMFILLLAACGATVEDMRGAAYATTLEECNRQATTLCASIACENKARAGNGRMPRTVPPSCTQSDSGADSGFRGSVDATIIVIKDGGSDG